MPPQPKTFDDVLAKIRAESLDKDGAVNKVELGKRFERVTRDFLSSDNHYRNRFAKVWMWVDWPGRDGGDTGIDLVAEQHDGGLCAIQCKCYADDGSLDTKQVSKFLAKAAGLRMRHRILVYTGEAITANARRLLEQNDCKIIGPDHFRDSGVDWGGFPKLSARRPKELRPHQEAAVSDVVKGLAEHDRGQLIMACGTGKTLASLHVAEKHCRRGGIVLYLVPSISLILQSMREWSDNSNVRHYYLAVCSDKSTGEDGSITELESPVSTDAEALAGYLEKRPADALTVVFSTYHSLSVVRRAFKEPFDLILCDEAHRTTGAEDKSFFTDVHSDSKVRGKKRLYMTATPRVYSDAILARTGKVVYSMDDEGKYGPRLHRLSFAEAVRKGILSDFRVKIAIVPADRVDKEFQQSVGGKEKSMPLDERTLLAAVWHGINHPDDGKKPKILQRVIAFANRIDRSMMFAGHAKDEEGADRSFESVVAEYEKWNPTGHRAEVDHIDGKTRALQRRDRMRWLDGSSGDPKTCRILSNARCLAEGVDVPALDGIVFLNPRKSRVDVVQSVGRVMRRAAGKKYGYVILPVAIPAGLQYHEALNDNKTFRVVWQVLNALRSHDEDFGHEINRLVLDKNPESTGPPRVSVSVLDETVDGEPLTKFFSSIKSKLVEKVGDINYYDKYGEKLGAAASTIEARIRNRMGKSPTACKEIEKLHADLKEMVGDSVTQNATVQIVAQHIVLSRVFDQLFSGQFTAHNPIAKVLEAVTKKIGMQEELHDLVGFYKDIYHELDGIKTREARQTFIKKIYGNFFESADKKSADKHGIVYTPIEVIDFIINSVNVLVQKHFGVYLNDRSVKILDPFAGTGTFLTRLLESGLVDDNLYEKYKNDLFADEIILLAYYIATVNIETTYSSLRRGGKYVPFDGISYTDTLLINPQYREKPHHRKEQSRIDSQFKAAHERIRQQRGSHVHVIMGNPPYSAKQDDYNKQMPNQKYEKMDSRISNTYVNKVKKINPNIKHVGALYDSYIRSIRWSSDRIGSAGVIALITNAGFLRSKVGAGIRASLEEEFDEIWCFDLRGNQKMQGEESLREGGKIFGSGSRVPVVITFLVKNPKMKKHTIRYRNIGNYLHREQKLKIVRDSKSIDGVFDWEIITPDKQHDWLNQSNKDFEKYAAMSSRSQNKNNKTTIFNTHSLGITTARDDWAYNSSKTELGKNMRLHIDYCNKQDPEDVKIDSKRGKWGHELSKKIKDHRPEFVISNIRKALYRPFFTQYLYFDSTRMFNSRIGKVLEMFPDKQSTNLVIGVSYSSRGFSRFVTNAIPDTNMNPTSPSQYCPLYIYEKGNKKYNITDSALSEYKDHYNDRTITKKDLFYYIYAMLHHPRYCKKFANNLIREIPRIPMAADFISFRDSGRDLVNLHLSFENCVRYDLGKPKFIPSRFSKLSFGRKSINGRRYISDRTVIRADSMVLFENIPQTTYRVNGRTPLEWIVDRYRVTTDKDSGITNDPCTGTNIVAVIERAVHIGLESERIINTLPEEFEPGPEWKPESDSLERYMRGVSYQSRI